MAAFDYEFVSLDSLPEDFFDPSSIEPDPEEWLRSADVGITLYWLGLEFPGGDGLPALSLEYAEPEEPRPAYRVRAVIGYGMADDPWGGSAIPLYQYDRGGWGSERQLYGELPCTESSEVDLSDWGVIIQRVVLGRGAIPPEACPDQGPFDWRGFVHLGDTVVDIFFLHPSPYSSEEGIEAIARALVPYE